MKARLTRSQTLATPPSAKKGRRQCLMAASDWMGDARTEEAGHTQDEDAASIFCLRPYCLWTQLG